MTGSTGSEIVMGTTCFQALVQGLLVRSHSSLDSLAHRFPVFGLLARLHAWGK